MLQLCATADPGVRSTHSLIKKSIPTLIVSHNLHICLTNERLGKRGWLVKNVAPHGLWVLCGEYCEYCEALMCLCVRAHGRVSVCRCNCVFPPVCLCLSFSRSVSLMTASVFLETCRLCSHPSLVATGVLHTQFVLLGRGTFQQMLPRAGYRRSPSFLSSSPLTALFRTSDSQVLSPPSISSCLLPDLFFAMNEMGSSYTPVNATYLHKLSERERRETDRNKTEKRRVISRFPST